MRQHTGDFSREPARNLYTQIGPYSRSRADLFYAVFSTASPDIVADWASLDETQYYQGESGAAYTGTVMACPVAVRRNVRQSSKARVRWVDRPSLHSLNQILDVLFIERVGIASFRRVGMGWEACMGGCCWRSFMQPKRYIILYNDFPRTSSTPRNGFE